MKPYPEVDEIIERWITRGFTDSPGCSLAISRAGQIIFSRGYGMANLDHRIPNTPSTVFHVASLAKQFTAMSVLLISSDMKNGKKLIRLDDDARDYIDELNGLDRTKIPKITIRQMLHNISGVRDMLVMLTLAGWRWGNDVITRENILDLVGRMQTVNFEPNTAWSYSNTNYFLAGEIVRRTTKMPLSEFAHKYIFEPLGMKNTRFVERHGEIMANRAYGYRKTDPSRQSFEMVSYTYDFTGPGGLFTTVEDLIRWDGNFDSKLVGGEHAVAALQKPYRSGADYGLGLYVLWDQVDDKPMMVHHNGTHPGYRTHLIRWHRDHITIALLCNLELSKETRGLVDEIATAVLGHAPGQAPIEPLSEPEAFVAAQGNVEPAGDFEDYCGSYYSEEIDTSYVVDACDSYLLVRRHTYPPVSLTHVSGDTFKVANFTAVLPNLQVAFQRDPKNKKVTGLRLDDLRKGKLSRLMKLNFARN